MDTRKLLDRFRSEVHDTGLPPLWSDEEVAGYADEAQKQLCRLSGGISDSTSALTRVRATALEPWGRIDSRILEIRYAKRASDNREVLLINFEDIQHRPVIAETYSRLPLNLTFDDTRTGEVRAMVVGMEAKKVRWIDVPLVDDTIELIVYRDPLRTISLEDLAELEVDEKHHIHLLKGMKAAAYGKEDAECFDKGKKEQYEGEFRVYCEQVREERERREKKHRFISYGGI